MGDFLSHKQQAIYRFLRYALVGGSTLLFDLLLLTALTELLHVPYFISTPVAFLIAVTINYFISRRFVFHGSMRSLHHGYLYFIVVGIAGALLTTGLVALLVQYAHLYYLLARVLVAMLVGMANYLFNLYVNFRVAGRHYASSRSESAPR